MPQSVNAAMPGSTVIPELAYPDVVSAAAWLCNAFGFTLRFRFGGHRAQLNIGDGAMVVTERATTEPGESTHAVMVRVLDVDAHCARARAYGAPIVKEPETYPYGERQYSVDDLGGHRWTFSQSVADFDPRHFGAVMGTVAVEPGPLSDASSQRASYVLMFD